MTNNARIVREALEAAIQGVLADQWDDHPSLDLRVKKKMEDMLLANFDDVYMALAALESELAATKADLAKALEAIHGLLRTAPFSEGCDDFHHAKADYHAIGEICHPWGRYKHAVEAARAALAPEQKGE